MRYVKIVSFCGYCGTPPLDLKTEAVLNKNAIWYDANPQDGMKVRIAYQVLPGQASVLHGRPHRRDYLLGSCRTPVV